MSVYALSIETAAEPGWSGGARAVAGEHHAIERLLQALTAELTEAIAEPRPPGESAVIEARIETVSAITTYKDLYEELSELDGERVRVRFADGSERTGALRVPVAALARELLLDGEELAWREVVAVELPGEGGDFRLHCEGPASAPWSISALMVLRSAVAATGRPALSP